MPRQSRVRGITLHEGSPFHEAFFGLDDSLRDNYDHEAMWEAYFKDVSNQRRESTSKAGRFMFPQT